jgi:hypothetical protein
MEFAQINIGDMLTCTETGKRFVAARDGCSVNYARGRDGSIISNEGVDLRERRELLDRTLPFHCYLSGDGNHVTGWKGNVLGHVVRESTSHTGWQGSTITHVRVIDCHGNPWHGKGAGRGMCITLRASKGAA